MSRDLEEYLSSSDPKTVARAARRLDEQALRAGTISKAEFKANSRRSDKQIFIERNSYSRRGPS